MSVYLGNQGLIELRRESDDAEKSSVVNASDVNVSRKRFSFDFDSGFLTSGDQVEIRSTTGVPLSFVSAAGWGNGVVQSQGHWYINVDELGGIRLYNTFSDAIAGGSTNAIALATPGADIPILVRISNLVPNIVAQCTYFELNTSREAVDMTALGDEFRQQHSGLISGSGTLRAFWEYLPRSGYESPHYLLQLAIRTEVGSRFSGKLYLKRGNGGTGVDDDEIWYAIDALVTQGGINFSATDAVELAIDFVTTGPIQLLAKLQADNKVLQESTGEIRLEQSPADALLQEAID